jgi:hypothetical protein
LDADDVWLKDKVASQVELLQSRPHLVGTYTALQIVDRHLRYVGDLAAPRGDVALRNTLLLEHPHVPGFCSTGLMRRWIFAAVGMFDEGLHVGSDREFVCRVTSRYPMEGIDRHLALYRRHGDHADLDPSVTQYYLRLMFDKVFADGLPMSLIGMRNRAEANLELSIAARYLRQKKYSASLTHVARALLRRPDRVLAASTRLQASRKEWKRLALSE